MDNFAVLSAFALGLFGTIFSVVQFFYQKKAAELTARDQAAREKEQEAKQAAREKEQAARDAARDKELELRHRLDFLVQVIIDKDIPRESRQPFYDEYIAKGGNGTVVKFWLENKG